MKQTLAGLALLAVGFTAGVIADVRVGTATIWDEAANGTTPTGRAFRNDVKAVVGQELEEAVDCINAWHSGEPLFNDYCPLEEAPPVP